MRCLITVSGSRLARARLGSRVSVSTSALAGVVLGEESNVYRPRNHRSHRDHRPGHLDASPLTRQRRRAWPAALGVSARGYLLKETAASSIGRTMQALVSGEFVLDSQLATRLSGLLNQPAATAPDLAGLTRAGWRSRLPRPPAWATPRWAALFRGEKAVRDTGTALLAKISLATPSACPARGAITSTHACHAGRAGVPIRSGQAAG